MTSSAAPTPIVSDDEIQAALSEATSESLPSLDDGSPTVVVPVQGGVPFDALPIDPRPVADAVGIPDRGAPESFVEPVAAPESEEPATDGFIYRTIDAILWAVNLPFGWLSPSARQIVGAAAAATIATSSLAIVVLPRLLTRTDTVTMIRERTQVALHPPPPPPPAEAKGGGHGGGAKAGAHGGQAKAGGHGGEAKAGGHGGAAKSDKPKAKSGGH